jgi:acetyltransferase-like isoleucine patch superfamily enzyme
MMLLLNKIYRKIFEKCGKFISFIRILHLRLKYPKLKINFGSYIGNGCEIICSDDSEMTLKNVYIAQNVVLRADNGGKMLLSNSYIGFGAVIVSANQIIIDDFCLIAEMVVIRDQNHKFNFTDLVKDSKSETSPIKIGKNVWIGAKATILKGVSIGDNSVIGANAVVTKDVLTNVVAVGIPAKMMKVN